MALKEFAIAFSINAALGAKFGSSFSSAYEKLSGLKKSMKGLEDQKKRLESLQSRGIVSAETVGRIQQVNARLARTKTLMKEIGEAQGMKNVARADMLSSVGSLYAGIATLRTVAQPLIGATSIAMDFQTAMSKVGAITNASASDMQKLADNARELGRTTRYTASQAAEAMSYLGMAGWNTNQILSGLPGLLSLAAASGADLATVADIISDDLTAFGMKAEQAGHMANVFAAAATNSNTNVQMMGQTFKYAGALAGSLGYSLEDVALATGLMANASIKSEQAGTSLRAIMTRLLKTEGESVRTLEELGVSVRNEDGSMRSFGDTIKDLRRAFSGLTQSEKGQYATALAGQEALSGFLAVVNASDEDFNKLSNAIGNCNGAADEMAKRMQDNAQGAWIRFKSAVDGLAESIGRLFLPALQSTFDALAEVMGRITGFAESHRALASTIIALVASIGTMAGSFFVYRTMAAGIQYLRAVARMAAADTNLLNASLMQTSKIGVSGSIRGVTTAIQGMSKAAMGFVFSPVGAALVAIAAAAYLIYNNWEKVAPVFENVTTRLNAAWEAASTRLAPCLEKVSSAVAPLQNVFEKLAEVIGGPLVGALLVIIEVMTGSIVTTIGIVSNAIGALIGVFDGLTEFLMGVFTADVGRALGGVYNIFASVFGGIKGMIDAVIGGLSGTINGVINAVSSWGGGPPHPVSSNASGGIYNKGAFLTTFAEDSAEAAIPLDGSRRAVGLWQRAGEMLGVAGDRVSAPPISITLNVTGDTDANRIKSAVVDAAKQAQEMFAAQMAAYRHEQRRLAY